MMNALAEQKRLLVAQGERYRQSIAVEVNNIKNAFDWIPRTVQVMRWATPVMAVAVPLLRALRGRKSSTKPATSLPERKSLLTKLVSLVQLYRKIKLIIDTFRPAR